MRWLAPSLLALALVFSTGGVAIVGRADSSSASGEFASPDRKPETQTSVAPAVQTSPSPQASGQCAAPRMARRAATRAKAAPRIASESKSIPLNTNGYNYPLEGQLQPDPVASPRAVPVGVLPQVREVDPAAPEAK